MDAYLDPNKLSDLWPEQARVLRGCVVLRRRQAHHFVGYMTPDARSYVSSESGKRVVLSDDLLLTEQALRISDRAKD